MSRTKTIFCSSEKSEVLHELTAYWNDCNEIFISINCSNSYDVESFICLDKETAIKFVKHLKREISKIKEEENGNI